MTLQPSSDAIKEARELLGRLCQILDALNEPEFLRSRVEITWDGVPQIKIIPMNWGDMPMAKAHWCDGAWKVDGS